MNTKRLLSWTLPSRRTLRLTTYLVFVCLGAAALAARAAHARANEAALEFGEQLSGLEDLTRGANVVLVNGERFHRVIAFVDDSVGSVLDRIQKDCETTPGLLGQAATEAARSHPKALDEYPLSPRILRGIVRHEEERRGMVACFTDSRGLGLDGLADAAKRFAKTSNLAEFGHFRYAFARRTDDGGTQVTTLWADTDLNLSSMFPAHGDAAGADSSVLPRPATSRRVLAASVEGQPSALRLYDTAEGAASVQRFYEDWLRKHGWIFAGKAQQGGFSYLRADGYQVIVTLAERQGRTAVGLIEAGRREGSIVSATVSVQ
jgi:hypothetical protein